MRALTETDIYQMFDSSGSNMSRKMKDVVKGQNKGIKVLNKKLESTITRFAQSFREPIVVKAVSAINDGKMVLFMAEPAMNLPECLPFFRYQLNGADAKVAVNMTNIVSIAPPMTEGEDEIYSVEDIRKFYAIIVAAYINLMIPDASKFSMQAMSCGARMWARMFCSVLNRTIGLSSSKDRYAAYNYFAMRFYLSYYIGAPVSTIDGICDKALPGGLKNPIIVAIEDYMTSKPDVDMYGSFTGFCQVLFNNEITNIKSLRMVAAAPNESLNVSFFMKRFIDSYHQSSIMSLASPHYFTWMVLCTQKKAYMMNIKMLGSVCDGIDSEKYLAALYALADG